MKKLSVWWCTNDPNNTGWYAEETGEGGRHLSDSVKVWFPIDLDSFLQNETQALAEALCPAFPEHSIYIENQTTLRMEQVQ